MEYTIEMIDEWIDSAGLREVVSVYGSAIEIDTYKLDDIPTVKGLDEYDEGGYRVLAQLLKTAIEGK